MCAIDWLVIDPQAKETWLDAKIIKANAAIAAAGVYWENHLDAATKNKYRHCTQNDDETFFNPQANGPKHLLVAQKENLKPYSGLAQKDIHVIFLVPKLAMDSKMLAIV